MEKLYKFPLKMHIGKPAKAIVEVGDVIKRGECIANEDGLGAKIHSSVNGVVRKITKNLIEIKADEIQSSEFVKIKECDSLIDYVIEAGVVGAGGAGFPTHVKLQAKIPKGYIIANCVECEPALKHNVYLIENYPQLVIKGIEYAMEATGAQRAYIAIKGKNKRAIEVLKKTLKNNKIEIKELRDMYPMGEERAIIHEIFGIWLRPDQLPLDANCVVLNGETLANITRAVDERKPVIDKDLTIIGKLKSGNKPNVELQVPVGTSFKSLIEKYGGIDGEYGEVIIGGPYTGNAQNINSSWVTKTSGGAIVTIPLPKFEDNMGLLVCACGNDEERLRDVAKKMGANVVGVTKCKNLEVIRGVNKCKTPGHCPGQVQGIIYLKNLGAKRVLISNCSDCSNTVMCCAPKMSIPVYHHTDHVFRTIDHTLTRRLPME
ncbi:MAG: proline reductase-associated electron transfer protein PrdC [Anaeromicrobium sp.]|jgi:proline reductase-associated electron transfer protein PrdC|uniref:proline reductase-associated electron transfer protein PrdC n=1 Tax=Anaeromicrobium sp. TaxID=1929132 RepID=UPI0025CE46A5|nr:proline reductase-associated electron transfer protein PrdC [Anaeromicrobium sp.]MCT4593622.1 proline reductase-associated electron transfer protein PrdC [Anaeromicrobium sp.]